MWRWAAVFVFGPVVALGQTAQPSVRPPTPEYAVKLPALRGSMPNGWGLYVVAKGRSLDLSQRGLNWSDDPAAPRTDLEAGYGWWSGPATTIVGYIEHDNHPIEPWLPIDARNPNEHRMGDSSVLGLGLVVHTR